VKIAKCIFDLLIMNCHNRKRDKIAHLFHAVGEETTAEFRKRDPQRNWLRSCLFVLHDFLV